MVLLETESHICHIFLFFSSARSSYSQLLTKHHQLFQSTPVLNNNMIYLYILAIADISKAFTQNSLWPHCDINGDHLAPPGHRPWNDLKYHDMSWHIIANNEVSWHIMIHDISIADICQHSHYRQWCTFFKPVLFLHKKRKILANFGYLVTNLRTFWYIYRAS